jgi:8-oxo-dGTP pyrophosphatase MutT (NUDIX family)
MASLAWLDALTPVGEAIHTWGELPIRTRSYVTTVVPPTDLVTSVRCIVLHGDDVLVMRNKDGRHIWPGGRREGTETSEETVRRELLEEAGCSVSSPVYLGFLYLRHLAPKPEAYPYLYPDFFQLIYAAQCERHDPEARIPDDYELESAFEPIADVERELHDLGEPAFLRAARDALG